MNREVREYYKRDYFLNDEQLDKLRVMYADFLKAGRTRVDFETFLAIVNLQRVNAGLPLVAEAAGRED